MAVEPTRSQNNTVRWRRSPTTSRAWTGCVSGTEAPTGVSIGLPQSAQNFEPAALSELQFEQRFDSGLPHSAQNFLPEMPSVPHFEQRILCSQLVEQCLGVFQIRGIEALGEPVVDLREHRARLVAKALRRKPSREANRRLQFFPL